MKEPVNLPPLSQIRCKETSGFSPIARLAAMMGDGQNPHRAALHVINNRVGKSMENPPPVALVVCGLTQRKLTDSFNGVEDLCAKGIRNQQVSFAIPKHRIPNIAFGNCGKFYEVLRQSAAKRARASAHGTMLIAPERMPSLRRRISSCHAWATTDSSSPSSRKIPACLPAAWYARCNIPRGRRT